MTSEEFDQSQRKNFSFKFPFNSENEVEDAANKYPQKEKNRDDEAIECAKNCQTNGFCEKSEFIKICTWKSPRPKAQYEKNSEAIIREITRLAFSSLLNGYDRLQALKALYGVKARTASAILHLVFYPEEKEKVKQGYPIMDIFAFKALGIKDVEPFNFDANIADVWHNYTEFCRKQAQKYNVDMRTLDRALWVKGKN